MMTDDKTMHEVAGPSVLINGRTPPANLGAQRWVVRLVVSGDDDNRLGSEGTGFVLSQQWILTARHVVQSKLQQLGDRLQTPLEVWAKVRRSVSMDLPADELRINGGTWFDDVILGAGDIAALHVAPQFQESLAGREAPVDWDFSPAIGSMSSVIAFTTIPTRLAMASGTTVRRQRVKSAHYGGVQIISTFGGGAAGGTVPGDSGGPVLADVPGKVGLQIIGVHNGSYGSGYRYWTPLHQEQKLLQKMNEAPYHLAWGQPNRVAVCNYEVAPQA